MCGWRGRGSQSLPAGTSIASFVGIRAGFVFNLHLDLTHRTGLSREERWWSENELCCLSTTALNLAGTGRRGLVENVWEIDIVRFWLLLLSQLGEDSGCGELCEMELSLVVLRCRRWHGESVVAAGNHVRRRLPGGGYDGRACRVVVVRGGSGREEGKISIGTGG